MTILHVLLMVNICLIFNCQYYFTFTAYPKTVSYYVCVTSKHYLHTHTHTTPTQLPHTHASMHPQNSPSHTHTHKESIHTSRRRPVYITKFKWQMFEEKQGADYEK